MTARNCFAIFIGVKGKKAKGGKSIFCPFLEIYLMYFTFLMDNKVLSILGNNKLSAILEKET